MKVMKNENLCKRRIKLKYGEYLCESFLIHNVSHKCGTVSGYNSWEVEDLDGNHIHMYSRLDEAIRGIRGIDQMFEKKH